MFFTMPKPSQYFVVACLIFATATATVIARRASAADKFAEPVDVSFTAKCDGTTQKYVVRLPVGFADDQPHALMIALHGHGSDRWQYATGNRDEVRAARDVALKYDMIFVSPDYRATTSWMGPLAEADMVQILEELKSKYKIEKTILIGASMGGSSSLSFTALHPELVDGVVSMNGTANHLLYEQFQKFIQASFGGTKQEIPMEYKRRSAEYWPERFTMPLAMSTGGKDTLVPADSCLRLSKVIKKLNPNVWHIHQPQGGHSTTYKDAVAALEFVSQRTLE